MLGVSTLLGSLGAYAATRLLIDAHLASVAVAVVLVATSLFVWLWARLPFTRIKVVGERLVVRSWWRTFHFDRRDLARCSADGYTGLLFILGWPVAAGRAEPGILRFERRDGSRIAVAGTVTWRSTATKQARWVNDWLGVPAERRERRAR